MAGGLGTLSSSRGRSRTSAIINPTTAEQFAEIPQATAAAVEDAIATGQRAFERWRPVGPGERARLLHRFADLVDRDLDVLARLEVENSGHTVSNARWEAGNVRDVLRYYAGAPHRLMGKQIPVEGGLNVTFHEPVGVVGIIVPWNFPMPIAAWGMAPALAAGNVVIVKPAEATPMTALHLGELATEAGFPPGVVQVLPGKGSVVGECLTNHPKVAKICFTGSTEVGRRIMAHSAGTLKRLTLELGGKSANIVFADADISRAAACAPYAVFDNAGQDCCARSRILVQREALDDFMTGFEAAVHMLKVEDPQHADSEMGPLISQSHRDKVRSYLDGAEVVISGSTPSGPGFWVEPTVVVPKSAQDPLWNEEIFGPVAAVMPFDTEEEAIALANDSEFGLSGSVYTGDVARAIRVCKSVQTGTLSVNSHQSVRYWTPFGGYKQSGLGRELGPDAPQAFCEEKNVFISDE